MKTWIIDHPQGSPEWEAARANVCNASDLAAVMGIDPNGRKRSDLVKQYATGIRQEFSDYVLKHVIEPGHEIERLAREIVEERIGESIYPVVYQGEEDGILLGASLDGQTMDGRMTFECKRRNVELWAAVMDGVVPEGYKPQIEQGIMLSGAEECLFTVSDGTDEGTISTIYTSDPKLRAKIIPTWKQFLADVAAYQPEPEVIPARVEVVEDLPAVTIQAFGGIEIRNNLGVFGDALMAYLERLPKKPETDDDFATLDDAVKRLKAAEEALTAAEDGALAQAASVDDMRRQVERWRKLARESRLEFETLVKAEKKARKEALVLAHRNEFIAHATALNEKVGGYMPAITRDWGGVIKGLKTLKSIKDRLGAELANAKVEADGVAAVIEANRKSLIQIIWDGPDATPDTMIRTDKIFLFPDFRTVCTKPVEDFANLLAARVAEERAREAAKEERIRAEEKAKAEREAQAKVQAESERIRVEEQAKAKDAQDAALAEQAAQIKADAEKKIAGHATRAGGLGLFLGANQDAAAVVVSQEAVIRKFLASREWGRGEESKARAILVEFVKFQAAEKLKVVA